MLRLALLGAAGSGKSRLARELSTAPGHSTRSVDEHPPLLAAATASALSPLELGLLARAHERAYDLNLLMGLDLPGTGPSAAQSDALLRQNLDRAGIAYRVVYGCGDERLAHALAALGQGPASGKTSTWVWACDTCSDPQCEHRLFTDLVAARQAA